MARRPATGAVPGPDTGNRTRDLPERLRTARLLVLAPHMDDETLACGGTLLLHRNPSAVHCLFATDGANSPAPLLPWIGRLPADLATLRKEEARAATRHLGIPDTNVRFLGLPDGCLGRHLHRLEHALEEAISNLRPEFVLAPFRYDVHPDHVALNRAARAVLLRHRGGTPVLLEYFVYHRLRGVPGGDVRGMLESDAVVAVNIEPVGDAKRVALDCYVSQVTNRYPWQDRPILTEESLEQRCTEPEYFLVTDPAAGLDDGLAAHAGRVRLATLAMRLGKRPKDRALAFLRWILGR